MTMALKLTALEIWETLELELQKIRDLIEHRDPTLSSKIEALINHFNGNIHNKTEYKVLKELKILSDNMKREDYFIKRKYKESEMDKVQSVINDLNLVIVALERDAKAAFAEEVKERKLMEERAKKGLPLHEKKDEGRLPNLDTNRAKELMEVNTDERKFD